MFGNATVRTVASLHTFVGFETWPNGWFLFVCVSHDNFFSFTVQSRKWLEETFAILKKCHFLPPFLSIVEKAFFGGQSVNPFFRQNDRWSFNGYVTH